MEKHVIYQRIATSLHEIDKLSRLLYAMSSTDIHRYPDNYEVLSMEAAIRAEKNACRLRHLVFQSSRIKKREYLKSAAEAMKISVSYCDGVLKVVIPGLMPRRKQSQSTEFLLDPLYYAMNSFMDKQHHLPRYRECVVHFLQEYDANLPSRRVRDYDNLELKQVLDIITAFALVDDGGLLCDMHNSSRFADEDRTVICVMKKDDFPRWLAAQYGEKGIGFEPEK